MWEFLDNDSRVDFCHYQLAFVDSLGQANTSYQANTTNTTVILSGILYNCNISFVLFANNCERKSAPVALAIYISRLTTNAHH